MGSSFSKLIDKYDVAGPRYTSYPPVPFWKKTPTEKEWFSHLEASFEKHKTRSVDFYLHIPFCRKLCFYCGCSRKISQDLNDGTVYVDHLQKEIEIYKRGVGDFATNSIHLGGGTPTFLKPEDLDRLISSLVGNFNKVEEFQGSFEADPRLTTEDHLKVFYKHGFNRVSFGVQDLSDKVQKAIGRVQPPEVVLDVTRKARDMGLSSINYDLIFGLPEQDIKSIETTFSYVKEALPDTIAFYSYAHVPHFAKNQKILEKYDIPKGSSKRELYERGRELLLDIGYIELGMDHFALPTSKLFKAYEQGTMSRNFMGYTIQDAPALVGLGVTSISNSNLSFVQNTKEIEDYFTIIQSGKLPIIKGHTHSKQDIDVGHIIHDIMCKGYADISEFNVDKLQKYIADNLISITGQKLVVNEIGRAFLRNISMEFDVTLQEKIKAGDKLPFSRTI